MYLIEEQEEVRTTRFTVLAFEQEFSTFKVPLIHGSINVACKISHFYPYDSPQNEKKVEEKDEKK